MDTLKALSENLRRGDGLKVKELTQAALREGISAQTIIDKGLFAGMAEVGRLFKEEEIYVPEVLMAAKAMQAGVDVLEPLLASAGNKPMGKIILGTVKGDVHNLGRNLVGIMLKGIGFKVIDLGENVSPEKFVDAAISEKAQLIGMSALLTTTMPYMKATIEALQKAGLKGKVKTMIGGACVTQRYADEIGADAYGENAGVAVDKANKLLGLK